MTDTDLVLAARPLGFPWATRDPFLFCVHHLDRYPRGNERLGPDASLEGRRIGMDFDGIDGWRMYHGDVIPGFPRHPHRGFETITIARQGFIDHSDSLGATARFGRGDLQWMTAGKGVVHSEMFPLLEREEPNPVELFQIWLNLPGRSKMTAPFFTMFWRPQIPRQTFEDGARTEVVLYAGHLDGFGTPPAAPPGSWASAVGSDVLIAELTLQPGARWTLPAAGEGVHRSLYFFRGESLAIGAQRADSHAALDVDATRPATLQNVGADEVEILVLQGRPIGEPVAHHGPFVMNTKAELQQAFVDFQRTGFGGWPWSSDSPAHARDAGRFARHADGREEQPPEG